jgi:hypothetical protein
MTTEAHHPHNNRVLQFITQPTLGASGPITYAPHIRQYNLSTDQTCKRLQNQFLARLAEILARFRSLSCSGKRTITLRANSLENTKNAVRWTYRCLNYSDKIYILLSVNIVTHNFDAYSFIIKSENNRLIHIRITLQNRLLLGLICIGL